MMAIGAMILTPIADTYVPGVPSLTYAAMAYFLLYVAAGLTVYTGVVYFRNGHGAPASQAPRRRRATIHPYAEPKRVVNFRA